MTDITDIEQDEHADIRDAVAKLCAQFPGEYWRKLDREMAYPSAFVDALTKAGYLSVLIPEEYGGAGLKISAATAILEEIHRAGCNAGACHAQMYTMGTVLRHGSDKQKAKYLPKIASGELRLQAFGVTEPTSGTDTTSLKTVAKRDGNDSYIVNGQKIWTSRAEYSDLMLLLARTTPKDEAKKRTDGLSVFLVDMREAKNHGLEIRPIRTMMNHSTTEVFFTDMKVPAENLIGEEGKGFRYILSGMNAERILISAESIGDAKWFIAKATAYAKERVGVRPADRPEPRHPVSDRKSLCGDARRRIDGEGSDPQIRGRPRLRRGSQHGQDAGGRCGLGRGQCLRADLWRLCLRGGIRHRAQVPRDPALPGGADLDQSDPVVRRRARAGHAALLLRTNMLPLEGIIVIAVEQAVAAPFCSSRLADAGAHVIKIERPEGDFARGYDAAAKGQSSYFVWLNRGKESVVIDLATKEGRAQLEPLIAGADVLLQNLKPGSMDKLGFSLRAPAKDYPALICCTISGYGDDGPYADRKAYDLLIQAESGLASITGGPEGPSRVGVSVVDIATGATAHAAILEALIARGPQRQGRRHPDLDVRRDGRLARGAPDQRRGRQPAAADWSRPSLDRALWRVPVKGRQGHPDLDPERARMEETLRRGARPTRIARVIHDSPTWSSASATARSPTGTVAEVLRR